MMLKNKKIKAGRVLDTIADVGSLLVSCVYFAYVILLLAFHLGMRWLNWAMLFITILYLGFFVAKLVALNRLFERNNKERLARFVLRYSKWAMKLVNALFVVLSVVSTKDVEGSMLLLIGVMMVILTFVISVLWDITVIIVRRKYKELWIGWDKLTPAEKSERIEMVINSFVTSIDAMAGVNLVKGIKIKAPRLKEGAPEKMKLKHKTEDKDDDDEE